MQQAALPAICLHETIGRADRGIARRRIIRADRGS
jgi:hypothetical protein